MNYRHAYHAGNHTEVFKHAVLVQMIESIQRKAAPICILDTHSGAGLYDLTSVAAGKTGEAKDGIIRVLNSDAPSLKAYLGIVRKFGIESTPLYPGSPSIEASLLRPGDRLILCEMHPEDGRALKNLFRAIKNVQVHARNGYEAMLALIPPVERRGLVFIDPPYEDKAELDTLTRSVLTAYRKWSTGVFMVWYPIKEANAARCLKDSLRAEFVSNCLCVEFLRYPIVGARLAGSGLVIINGPWKFEDVLARLCSELASAFGTANECNWSIKWIGKRK
jgi:23S rRNA (adenine2030-N6)-methyltransferase